MKVKLLSRVRLLATPWAAAYQGPPSMGFSKQEYWSGGAIAFSDSQATYTNLEMTGKKLEFISLCVSEAEQWLPRVTFKCLDKSHLICLSQDF